MATVQLLIDEIAQIRSRTVSEYSAPRDSAALLAAADALDQDPLRHEPAVHALINDLRENPDAPTMSRTKRHINQRVDNTVLSVFAASYFPSLGLDAFHYETIWTEPSLTRRYPSPTVPARLLEHSAGFSARAVVALFPENHIDGQQRSDDLIFYFINKFIERHALTRRLITEAMTQGCFPRLDGAGPDDVSSAAAAWVHLHEFHHRTGSMPIPAYIKAKSYKPLAGLEELRTDLKSMLACYHDRHLDRDAALLTFEFILAERLLRYAVEGIPIPNYDAIASQLLFNFLREHDAVRLRNDRLSFGDNLISAMESLDARIAEIEATVVDGVETARSGLIELTRGYTTFDEETRRYTHDPYFAELKTKLGV